MITLHDGVERYTIGSRISARLGAAAREDLTYLEQRRVRSMIRSMVRTCEYGCCAKLDGRPLTHQRVEAIQQGTVVLAHGRGTVPVSPPSREDKRGLRTHVSRKQATISETLAQWHIDARSPEQAREMREQAQAEQGWRAENPEANSEAEAEAAEAMAEAAEQIAAEAAEQIAEAVEAEFIGEPEPEPEPEPEQLVERTGQTRRRTPASSFDPTQVYAYGHDRNQDAKLYAEARFADLANYLEREQSSLPPELGGEIVSYRANQGAARMIDAGLPPIAPIHAYLLDWPEASKSSAVTLPDWDPTDWAATLPRPDGEPPEIAYLVRLVAARQPFFLIGPAGTGKTRLFERLGEMYRTESTVVPMNEGASISWLFGRATAAGFVEAEPTQRYEGGGILGVDEIDAADANMALALNMLIANDEFTNPLNGQHMERSAGFVIGATANTMGHGADPDYSGRNQLDAATLDRFRLGRLVVGYDQQVREKIGRADYQPQDLPAGF